MIIGYYYAGRDLVGIGSSTHNLALPLVDHMKVLGSLHWNARSKAQSSGKAGGGSSGRHPGIVQGGSYSHIIGHYGLMPRLPRQLSTGSFRKAHPIVSVQARLAGGERHFLTGIPRSLAAWKSCTLPSGTWTNKAMGELKTYRKRGLSDNIFSKGA